MSKGCSRSEWRNAPHPADEVGDALGQSCAGLFHLEAAGQQVEKGAVAHGNNGAGQADDIVGHAEVRSGQVDQERLCVDAQEVAGLLFIGETIERRQTAQTRHLSLPRQSSSPQRRARYLQAAEKRAFPRVVGFHGDHAGYERADDRRPK